MEKHYRRIARDTDERVAASLRIQELDKNSPFYGGFYDGNQLAEVKFSIYKITTMLAAYCCADSAFYRSKEAERAIGLGLSYVERAQHENGLFDYITCNFFSAPDTAFCIKRMMPAYEFLRGRKEKTEAEKEMEHRLGELIKKGAYGMLEGGFHTPNHRWAIASVLAKAGSLFDAPELSRAAQSYLIEGIDCDEDGEYSEKSAGNYNRINNDAMIMLAEAFGNDSYEQHVIRNLRMMLTYLEPDGSIFTANSTRFDKDLLVFPEDYYMEYLWMGMKYRISEFLDMCNAIFDIVEEKQLLAPDVLIYFLLRPDFRTLVWEGRYVPKDFCKFYEKSGILRARRGHFTYTVMKGKSDFLYLHNGTMKLMMKVAGSFCEHRAFRAEAMERTRKGEEDAVCLHQTMRGWYYLPFPEKPETSDWWQMDQAARPKKFGPDMDVDVSVTELPDGLRVRIKTSGVKGAPWRIETALTGIEAVEADSVLLPVGGNETLVSRDETLKAYNEKDAIIMGPGFGAHRFTQGKEGSEAKMPGCVTIYYTDYTEFDHTIVLRNQRDARGGQESQQ